MSAQNLFQGDAPTADDVLYPQVCRVQMAYLANAFSPSYAYSGCSVGEYFELEVSAKIEEQRLKAKALRTTHCNTMQFSLSTGEADGRLGFTPVLDHASANQHTST